MSYMQSNRRACALGLLVPLILSGVLAAGAPAQGVITNGVVSLGWAPSASHGLVFTSVGDSIESAAFPFRAADLWQVEFRNPAGPTVTTLGASDLSGFTLAITQGPPGFLSVTWSQCTSALLPPGVSFSVSMTAQAPAGANTVRLSIGIQANTASAV